MDEPKNQSMQELTFHQEAIWLESKLHPQKPIFNIGTYVQLNGVPQKALLQQAIDQVIAQNDALRINIHETESNCFQEFEFQKDCQLESKQFEREQNAIDWMRKEFVKPLNIEDSTLFQIVLVQYAGDECYLFFRYHHIFIDGWARALLVRKVAEQYNALLTNKRCLSESAYATYCSQLQASRTSQAIEESLSFWESRFLDAEINPIFPQKDLTRNRLPGDRIRMVMERDFFSSLTPSFYVLLAALYVTFSRSTGQQKMVFGIPLLNRFNEEQKNTIGYFVGIIPLQLSFPSSIAFEELIEGIRAEMRTSIHFRNVGIHEINRKLGINFSNSTQLYQVVFSYEAHNHDVTFGEATVTKAGTFSSDYEQNPLVIHVQDFVQKDDVQLEFDFNTNYLNTGEVQTLIGRFQRVIEYFAAHPGDTLAAAPLLSKNEHELLHQFAQGANESIPPKNLVELIREKARSHPTKVIVRDQHQELTYTQLIEKAEQVAANLQRQGIGPGDSVGVMMPRSTQTIVANLGVLMSGGRYVPIEAALPAERIKYMLFIAEVKVLLHSRNSLKAEWDFACSTLDLSNLQEGSSFREPDLPSDLPAYIIFTSGTTGNPKGVCINHSSVANLVRQLHREIYVQYDQSPTLALIASFNFDQSVQHAFASLVLGHQLCIAPEEARKDGTSLMQFLVDFEVEICDGITTQIAGMLAQFAEAPPELKVTHFILGGEAFGIELAHQLVNWMGDRPLTVSNAYGPTETTVFSTQFVFDRKNIGKYQDVPLGRPVVNTQIWVLSDEGELLPPGVKGEICIGGQGLSTGYVNQEALTREQFVECEALDVQRIYRTGDIGSWDEKGILFYHGRKDSQVKVRGYRIELSAIQQNLNKIPSVLQSLVLAEKQGGQQRLYAFVESEIPLSEIDIKTQLKYFLPDYMIPHQVYSLAQLPLNATGKIDRKALLKIVEHKQLKPTTELLSSTQGILRDIFRELLNRTEIDPELSFFDQGGDSLTLISLMAAIRTEFSRDLDMGQFATLNSVRKIGDFIDSNEEVLLTPVSFEEELAQKEAIAKVSAWNTPPIMNHALLTGATGFVGAFLLAELVKHFDKVYCLIRGDNHLMAVQKLEASLARYQLKSEVSLRKVKVILGDLSKTKVGISNEDEDLLIHNVASIFHCGAKVNFISDYRSLYPTNVSSTIGLLKLCRMGQVKQFNYISTKGVFSGKEKIHTEWSSIHRQIHFEDRGYETSKWISEGMVEYARKLGIQANIFRLGRITGHATKGIANHGDFFHRFWAGCLHLKAFPQEMSELVTDLTPVDIAVRGIVLLANLHQNQTFHLVNPHVTSYGSFLTFFDQLGTSLDLISYGTWLERVQLTNQKDNRNPLYLITPILKDKKWLVETQPNMVGEATNPQLQSLNTFWPEQNELLKVYSKRMLETIYRRNFSSPKINTII